MTREHDDHITYIGDRHRYGGREPFGIRRADARLHTFVIGKTGTGKSTLLRNLLVQHIEAGHGVGLIDPHGDLATELLDYIPRWRTDEVIYFNPGDYAHPISFNPLAGVPPHEHHTRASAIVGAMKSVWRDSWGPRLEYLLHAVVMALVEAQNVSLLGAQRMLTDERYRRHIVRQVRNAGVRRFWEQEFAGYDKRQAAEVVSPAQNKLGQLLLATPMRNILGQVRSRLDLRYAIDNRRIFIANLAKGSIGEDKANLLGSLLVSLFASAAMSRTDEPEEEREDFTLVIDEFQNFTTDAFASILAESRKVRLSLALGTQFIAQMRDEVRDAVFGNVGTTVAFRVGASDAIHLEREYVRRFVAEQFTDLPNYEALVRTIHRGESLDPFRATTFSPIGQRHGRGDTIIQQSRNRYAETRPAVECRIERWMRA